MDPSDYMHQYGGNASGPPPHHPHFPQGSKLATYMNRPSFQQQPPQPQPHSYRMSDMNKGLISLSGVDSNTMKKLAVSGIREFVPQPSQQQQQQFSNLSGRPHTSNNQSSFDRMSHGNNTLNTPPPTMGLMGGNSPRQSPTPATMGGMMNSGANHSAADAATAANMAAYSDGGTTWFYQGDEMGLSDTMMGGGRPVSVMVPSYALYAGLPNQVAASRVRQSTPGFIAQSDVKMEILKRQYVCMSEVNPEAGSDPIPDVDNFHHLVPLEPIPATPLNKSQAFGYMTTVYKSINVKNGSTVCLRRVHGFRLVNTKCMVLVDQWKKLQHSNLVSLKQVFTTKTFGDHSIIFIYDFYPGAETLTNKHFANASSPQITSAFNDPYSARPYSQSKNQMLRQQAAMLSQNGLLPESLLWNYVIQLTAALRHIHSAGLACRTLDPSKILIFGGQRLLLNCCGMLDVLTFDPSTTNPMAAMAHYQQEDLIALGKIVLALACNSFHAIQRENLQTSMEVVTSTYSSDLRNFIMYLLTNPARIKSINDLMPMIGARFYNQLDAAYMMHDTLEIELAKEIESSRLFRVLTKLCTVVDRAELNGDYSWSDYGDCYMLKLFRDYVFHQVMDDGRPWLDMAHVVTNLNKLDAGLTERICLMSRDEQNVLVVSYSELKRCLEQAFGDCVQATRPIASSLDVGSS